MSDTLSYRIYTKPSELDKAVNTLCGIIEGIQIDNAINQSEILELVNWCTLHRHLIDRHPFSEIIPLIDEKLSDDDLTPDELMDIAWVCDNIKKESVYYDLITNQIQQLQGIFHGILADAQLTDEEIFNLQTWIENHDFLNGTYPYDEIKSLLSTILADQKITSDENNILKSFLSDFVDLKTSYNIHQTKIDELKSQYSLQGICVLNPPITIINKTFCFTGESEKAKRKEIAEIITDFGGIFSPSVTKKTDYSLVGNSGNPCWAFSCYGRKVEKAVELRKLGQAIIIVNENDFWNFLKNS